MAKVRMLTTSDNPYDPFTDYDEWEAFDISKGYHTMSYIARVLRTSDALSDQEQEECWNDAIDEIVKYDLLGIYKVVEGEEEEKIAEKDDSDQFQAPENIRF